VDVIADSLIEEQGANVRGAIGKPHSRRRSNHSLLEVHCVDGSSKAMGYLVVSNILSAKEAGDVEDHNLRIERMIW
jgi:hypothetical protein